MPTLSRIKRIVKAAKYRQTDLVVVLENIKNPHNASAILRSCEAFGIQEVHIIKKEKAIGISKTVSSGTHKWLDIYFHESAKQCIKHLKEKGFKIMVANISKHAMDIRQVNFCEKLAIVMGNELEGPSEDILSLCDGQLFIPIIGLVESFNVSVACAIILYEAFRQRSDKGLLTKLSRKERKKLARKLLERI